MIFLTVEEIINLHKKLIKATGGHDGLRDRGLLESAVYGVFASYDDIERYPSIEEKAARCAFGPIYHGLKLKRQVGNININILSDSDYVVIEVTDDGLGMKKEKLNELRNNLANSVESEQYGLYNINERLKLTFKDEYSINIDSEYNHWARVSLRIPKIRSDSNG